MASSQGASKIAIVTGAGTGAGLATACKLAKSGYHVFAIGRRADKLAAAKEQAGDNVTVFSADVGNQADVERVVKQVLNETGRIDVLVNNAGVNFKRRRLNVLTQQDWDDMLRINLTGAYMMIQAVLPAMRSQKDGLIVNISSVGALRPGPLGGAGYCASKAALNALSTTLTLEEAEHGIRSTVVCPGEIDTPLLDERPEPVSAERRAIALRPDDIADTVLFLVNLPARAHVPELIIKPTLQAYA